MQTKARVALSIKSKAYLMCWLWWTCVRSIRYFFLMLETKESISEIVITFCKKCPSFDHVLKRGPGIDLSSRLVRTWLAYLTVAYSFLVQELFLRIHESVSVTFLDIFCWIHWVTTSELHKRLGTMYSNRHHHQKIFLAAFWRHFRRVYSSWTISVICFDIFFWIIWVTP